MGGSSISLCISVMLEKEIREGGGREGERGGEREDE